MSAVPGRPRCATATPPRRRAYRSPSEGPSPRASGPARRASTRAPPAPPSAPVRRSARRTGSRSTTRPATPARSAEGSSPEGARPQAPPRRCDGCDRQVKVCLTASVGETNRPVRQQRLGAPLATAPTDVLESSQRGGAASRTSVSLGLCLRLSRRSAPARPALLDAVIMSLHPHTWRKTCARRLPRRPGLQHYGARAFRVPGSSHRGHPLHGHQAQAPTCRSPASTAPRCLDATQGARIASCLTHDDSLRHGRVVLRPRRQVDPRTPFGGPTCRYPQASSPTAPTSWGATRRGRA